MQTLSRHLGWISYPWGALIEEAEEYNDTGPEQEGIELILPLLVAAPPPPLPRQPRVHRPPVRYGIDEHIYDR